jgi:hypothetical protein
MGVMKKEVFVKYPIRIDENLIQSLKKQKMPCAGWLEIGNWVVADVLEDGYSIPALAACQETEAEAADICRVLNIRNGFTEDQVDDIVWSSMQHLK